MNFVLNKRVSCLIIFLSALFLYANTLNHGFVWDDHYLIEENSRLQNPASIGGFFTKDFWQNSSMNFESGFYRPLTLVTFFINYNLWQGEPFGFHLVNVLLHGVNGILVFLVLLSLSGNRGVSFLSGLLFIAHPVQTETVAYIVDINDLLAVLFILLCCRYYILFSKESGRGRHLGFSLFFLMMALLSKESAIVAVALLFIVDWYYLSKQNRHIFLRKWPAFLSYGLVTLIYLCIRILILGGANAVTISHVRYVSILPAFDFWSHILMSVKIVFLYIKLLIFPWSLSISYVMLPPISIFSPDVFFTVIALATLGGLIFICRKEEVKWISFSLSWFFICIFPVSNLIPFSYTIAERFLYLPMVGFSFLLAHALYVLKEKWQRPKWKVFYFWGILAVILAVFSYKTVTRNPVWKSDFSLFRSAVDSYPCAPIAHVNLSAYYYRQKDQEKGDEEYRKYRSCLESIQGEYSDLKYRGKK